MKPQPHVYRIYLVWILFSAVAVYFAMQWLPAALTPEGVFVPVGPDSFYHAARITEAIHGSFFQFDDRMHVPEGSWIPWPWAYDYVVAKAVGLLMWITGNEEPMSLLVYFPVCWLFVNTGLVFLLARGIGLSLIKQMLAMACFVLSPLTQQLHSVGAIDHHYVELTFILLFTWVLVTWCRAVTDTRWASVLGVVLGIAPAFHNGLFILQIPLLLTLFVAWLKHQDLPLKPVAAIALALVVTTLIVLLPSGPFWDGQFRFYTLSWFHLFAALGTATVAIFFALSRFSTKSLALLIALGLTLVAVAWSQLDIGNRFLRGELFMLDSIMETQNVVADLLAGTGWGWMQLYSWLLLLLPVGVLTALWAIVRSTETWKIGFFSTALLGLMLLSLQFRLHYFGFFFLYLTLLWLAQQAQEKFRLTEPVANSVLAVVVAVAYFGPVKMMLRGTVKPGGEFFYAYTRQIYPRMSELCAQDPGVVFADDVSGHYIRYHTECSVLSNSFNITSQHEAKIRQMLRLMSLSPEEFRKEAPFAKYVYVTRRDNFLAPAPPEAVAQINRGLRYSLLFESEAPEGFEKMGAVGMEHPDGSHIPIAALYRLERQSVAEHP